MGKIVKSETLYQDGGVPFQVVAPFVPTGDQPEAIERLVKGIQAKNKAQVLLGGDGHRQDVHRCQGD